jgi:hypothetical protein
MPDILILSITTCEMIVQRNSISFAIISVGDPDLDSHVFGLPGSGSVSQKYRSGTFPFIIRVSSRLK